MRIRSPQGLLHLLPSGELLFVEATTILCIMILVRLKVKNITKLIFRMSLPHRCLRLVLVERVDRLSTSPGT